MVGSLPLLLADGDAEVAGEGPGGGRGWDSVVTRNLFLSLRHDLVWEMMLKVLSFKCSNSHRDCPVRSKSCEELPSRTRDR